MEVGQAARLRKAHGMQHALGVEDARSRSAGSVSATRRSWSWRRLVSRVSGVENFKNGSAAMSPCAPIYAAASGTITWAWQSIIVVFSLLGSVETLLAAVGP